MEEKSLAGAIIPDTILNENIKCFGFAPIPQYIPSSTRLTSEGSQTSTNNRYTACWSYDMMTNLAIKINTTGEWLSIKV